jgi:AcrR family transcriptional regulator
MSIQKNEIADVFQKYFNQYGMKKTSVDEVAKELRISKKTIYQHFSTKEEAFYFVISRIADQYRASMEAKLVGKATREERLVGLVKLIFAESRPWLKKNKAFEFKYKYEIAQLAFQDSYSALIHKWVEEGMQAGEFPKKPVGMSVRFFRGILAESMGALAEDPNADIEESAVEAVIKILK